MRCGWRDRKQERKESAPGCPGFRLLVPGLGVHLGSSLFLVFQPLTFIFNFGSPTVTFSAQNRPSTTECYCLVVTNAREWRMFARGWPYLHTACPEQSQRAHLPALKSLASKPCVSITSKLIEIKRLQVLYSGHLRKTGGRGSNQRMV